MGYGTNDMSPADLAAVVDNRGYGGFGGGDGLYGIIVLFILMAMMGNGFGFGGFGGGFGGGGGAFPWLLASGANTNNDVQRGFDQSAIMGSLGGIQASVNNGFATAEVAECNRAMNAMQTAYNNQIATMNQNFAAQTALDNRLDSMEMAQQNCCCENRAAIADLKYTVATENCADRNALSETEYRLSNLIGDKTQALQDKLCQLEMDGFKRENLALQRKIDTLETNNYIQNALTAQTMYLRPPINPAFIVSPPYQIPETGTTTTT